MRKPRNLSTSLKSSFDSELKALNDKARILRERRLRQLGELVIACGADVLAPEHLAGALLAAAEAEAPTQEGWRRRGAAFFQRQPRRTGKAETGGGSVASGDGGPAST